MRQINRIIIHCSDSDIPSHDDISVIRDWHTKRGFTGPDGVSGSMDDVGYHFFIKRNGVVQSGRAVDDIGAHCFGYNSDSIGICLSGRSVFTVIQYAEMIKLIKDLMLKFKDIKEIKGHRYYNKSKTCPNFDVDSMVKNYIESSCIE